MFKIKIALLLMITTIFACQEPDICDCLKRSGKPDSVTYFFDDVRLLKINNKFNVFLIQDTVNKAVVSSGANLLELVEIQYSDSVLSITDNNICNFARDYDVEITVNLHIKNLNQIDVCGPSQLFSNDTLFFDKILIRVLYTISKIDLIMNTNHLWFELWLSSGDITLSGKTQIFELLSHGYAYIRAFDFEADVLKFRQVTTGYTEINAVNELYVSFFDVGDVYYVGNPEIIKIEENTSNKQLIHVE